MSKVILVGIGCLLIVFAVMKIFAAAYHDPLLTLDMANVDEYPKRLRFSTDPIKVTNVDTTGLASLHILGSAQFSERALQKILAKLNVKRVTVVDLRQESHGFLNGNAISWYGLGNATNANKKNAEIEKTQSSLLHALSLQKTVTIYKIIKKDQRNKILKAEPLELTVERVLSEEQLAHSLGLNYRRFYVQDFHAPKTAEIDRFVEFAKKVPSGEWLYFHCRGGSGRSTTFMILFDMMHNAKKVTFENILIRHAVLGGKDLTKLPVEGSYRYPSALIRLQFLKKFYEYAQQNKDAFSTSWSRWAATHH